MIFPEWVDARAFYAWIEERDPDWRAQLSESQQRAMKRMIREPGAKVSLRTVDGICCRLSLHINEIPAEIWTTKPKSGGRNGTPKETRAAILREVENGEPIRSVARRYGVARKTIQVWKRNAA